MIENFDVAMQNVFKSEGGYANDPRDPGGETNLGVTKASWAEYLNRSVGAGEMAALTKQMVIPFYKKTFWDACKCDLLPTGVDYALFDASVNMGCSRAIKLLQEAIGATADGVIGPKTLALIEETNPIEMLDKFSEAKNNFYRSLPTFATFGKGWLARVASVQTLSENMIHA